VTKPAPGSAFPLPHSLRRHARLPRTRPPDHQTTRPSNHLGSTSLATTATGGEVGRQWYYPYGDQRHATGTLPTNYRFTGQQWQGTIALYDYGARFYDPVLGRFVSADSIVPEPGNPQALNRFSYVLNNPLRYVDSTGHFSEDEILTHFFGSDWAELGKTWEDVLAFFREGGQFENQWGWLEMLRQANSGYVLWFGSTEHRRGGRWTSAHDIGYWTISDDGKFYIHSGYGLVSADVVAELAAQSQWIGYRSTPAAPWGVSGCWSPRAQRHHVKFDPDRVDWLSVGSDVLGIAGDVGLATGTPAGAGLWVVSQMAELALIGKSTHALLDGDPMAASGMSGKVADMVATGSGSAKLLRLAPLYGWVMNITSLTLDLGQGFYATP